MGSDRRKYQDKSKAQVSISLFKEFNINRAEVYEFWLNYQSWKRSGDSASIAINYLRNNFDIKITEYLAVLALEMLSKEIAKGFE